MADLNVFEVGLAEGPDLARGPLTEHCYRLSLKVITSIWPFMILPHNDIKIQLIFNWEHLIVYIFLSI